MIRKAVIAVLAVAAVGVVALSFDAGHLAPFVKTLNSAEGLDVSYTVQEVGRTSASYHVTLAKPDLAMIDTPAKTFYADGETITTYDKKRNKYFTKEQTHEALTGLFDDDDLAIWRSFFDSKAMDRIYSSKNEGTKKRRGETLRVISAVVNRNGDSSFTLYIGESDGLLKQAQFTSTATGSSSTKILNTKSINTKAVASATFAFTAPEGAEEMTVADLSSSEWITEFDVALENAAALGKGVIIDFYADW
ncbi:MAG: DUF2092 domain-containing protein [Armatimonadetes bacterium]|nr:DUF2092 domain-containing protein [Armatimonadota bacterium]